MRLFWGTILATTALIAAGCSSVRKLSRVDSREPATARKLQMVSSLRASLAAYTDFSKACPRAIRELMPSLSEEKVSFPPCPPRLEMDFSEASTFLSLEARNVIEGVVASQCRSAGEPAEEALSALLDDFDAGTGAARAGGVRGERQLSAVEDHSELLKRLKAGLEEVRSLHLPLDQWTRRFGEFVLAEEELDLLEKLVVKQHCRMENQEIDQAYRAIRGLEDLARLEREGEPQKQRIERFLAGVHQLIDQRLQELFKP